MKDNDKLICPLMFVLGAFAVAALPELPDEDRRRHVLGFQHCIGEKCGWWSQATGRCGVVVNPVYMPVAPR